jgi:hypothetical protein
MLAAAYPTKKALKQAIGQQLSYIETSCFGPEYRTNGKFAVVGPSPYERKWYASVTVVDDKITKVS